MAEQADLLSAPVTKPTTDVATQKTPKEIEKHQKTLIRNRYKEFLPKGSDPIKLFKQWTNSIFGTNPVDEGVLYFILSVGNASGIDVRVPRQIYAVPYNTFNKDTQQWEKRYQVITGIEGMVTIAENSKGYGGTTKPEYEFDETADGKPDLSKPISCTVGVYKIVQGIQNISYQTVYFDEYFVPGKNNKKGEYVPSMWETKGKTMLKKVALAHALRATFTACAGLYIEEEMQRGEVIEGETIKSAPDVQAKIESAGSIDELQSVWYTLNAQEKQQSQSIFDKKFSELA